MTIKEFFSDKFGDFLLQIISMAALAVFLLLTGTSPGVLAIIMLVWLVGLLILSSFRFIKKRAQLDELEKIMAGLDQKYLFAECIPKPKSNYDKHLYTLLGKSGKSMIESVSDAQSAQRNYREYIESWVHEIKAPITAAKLICRNLDAPIRKKMHQELTSVEDHVERALFYARMESPEKDFIIQQTQLSDLVAKAIEKHQTLLIQSGVRLETTQLETTVYTDRKWMIFMLGQFLQNAVRYRSETPMITITAKELGQLTQLVIEDNGIGIPQHELPRVF